MSTTVVPELVKGAVSSWMKDVTLRREVTSVDPVADAIAYCARDLEERIRKAEAAGKTLSTREYGRIHGVRDTTVRKWIAAGEIEAHQNPSGDWEIPRSAIRHRKQKRKARA